MQRAARRAEPRMSEGDSKYDGGLTGILNGGVRALASR